METNDLHDQQAFGTQPLPVEISAQLRYNDLPSWTGRSWL